MSSINALCNIEYCGERTARTANCCNYSYCVYLRRVFSSIFAITFLRWDNAASKPTAHCNGSRRRRILMCLTCQKISSNSQYGICSPLLYIVDVDFWAFIFTFVWYFVCFVLFTVYVLLSVTTPWVKKTRHLTLAHNFTKYWPIFKILSLLDSVGNL